MDALTLHLINCYGIGLLEETISYSDNNCCIIYAPNGTMKTSLTKVFQNISLNTVPRDLFYPERETTCDVYIDGQPIDSDSLYVFQNEKADGKEGVSTFLANSELKKRYDDIHQELAAAKKGLSKNIKTISSSSDIEPETVQSFKENDTDNFYDCLLKIKQILPADGSRYPLYSFKFNDVFDKDGLVLNFLTENEATFKKYFDTYARLISQSNFFSSGSSSFGTTQANALLTSVGDDRFFHANHCINLKDGTTIGSNDALKQKISEEVEQIFNNKALKSLFDDIEKKLSKNTALKNFKAVIQGDPTLIPKLADYDSFRKETIMGYLQNFQAEFDAICSLYETKKKELESIIQEARNEQDKWKQIIALFNARFFVPFKVVVNNVTDVLLNAKTASLGFSYKDDLSSNEVSPDEKVLIDTMSTGEVKAFNILQNLFAIEGRKSQNKETLIVLDDIADSFDYKNKYAIIEYLNDLQLTPLFKLLILTHNFDFYRTVVSRLNVNNHKFAYKTEDRNIKFGQGIHNTDILKNKLIKKADTSDTSFIGLIPFVRNIIEYTEGDSDDYKLLTACLHIKDSSAAITKGEVSEVFKRHIQLLQNANFADEGMLYWDVLKSATRTAMTDPNEIELSNKLALSISIRLDAELYMKSKLTPEQMSKMKQNDKQTMELFKLFKEYFSSTKPEELLLMNKVLMLTSENIHLNNFMFEPLVDLSIQHLRQLYSDVHALIS